MLLESLSHPLLNLHSKKPLMFNILWIVNTFKIKLFERPFLPLYLAMTNSLAAKYFTHTSASLKTPGMPRGTYTVSTATCYGRTTPAPEDTVLFNSFQIVGAGLFVITSFGEVQQLSSPTPAREGAPPLVSQAGLWLMSHTLCAHCREAHFSNYRGEAFLCCPSSVATLKVAVWFLVLCVCLFCWWWRWFWIFIIRGEAKLVAWRGDSRRKRQSSHDSGKAHAVSIAAVVAASIAVTTQLKSSRMAWDKMPAD